MNQDTLVHDLIIIPSRPAREAQVFAPTLLPRASEHVQSGFSFKWQVKTFWFETLYHLILIISTK